MPFHSMPSVNRGDDESGAPKTVRATAPGRKIHMQKSPSHVQNCTGARRRIVSGISRKAPRISAAVTPRPLFAPSFARKACRSSGVPWPTTTTRRPFSTNSL